MYTFSIFKNEYNLYKYKTFSNFETVYEHIKKCTNLKNVDLQTVNYFYDECGIISRYSQMFNNIITNYKIYTNYFFVILNILNNIKQYIIKPKSLWLINYNSIVDYEWIESFNYLYKDIKMYTIYSTKPITKNDIQLINWIKYNNKNVNVLNKNYNKSNIYENDVLILN